jgi:hypothetical protein
MKKQIIALFIIFTGLAFSVKAQMNTPDIIDQIEPSSASANTSNLTVTITLKNLGTPPVPPEQVTPSAVKIGTMNGQNIVRNKNVVKAIFTIPSSEPTGSKDLTLTFPSRNRGSIIFTKDSAFRVTDSTDGGHPTDPEPDPAINVDEVTLYAPLEQTTTFLVDADGNVIKTWESDNAPALSAYLLDDKSLLRTTSLGRNGNTVFGNTGGAGGRVERFDWDGNKIWEFEYSTDNYLLHHDIEYLPNGNILMIAWQVKNRTEAIQAGRNPFLLSDGELWPDKIIEVAPNSGSGGTIVWEWCVWDHLVQDYDASKANYGVISQHPEKIDLNFVLNRPGADWTHINAIDYNPDLDQILLTVRNFSEVWIIDHNTTTTKAAGAAGDLLYRWGNPQTYDRGSSDDQMLFVPHDGQWIESDLPGEGDILIFNNGEGRPNGNYSSVDQFTPPVNARGDYTLDNNAAYAPTSLTWSYQANPEQSFYANHISGAQRLANGHTLICDGPAGTFFQVTDSGTKVWEYVNPYTFTNPRGQTDNSVFRAIRYNLSDSNTTDPIDQNPDPLPTEGLTYPIVDTGQSKYYNDLQEISAPGQGESFYGQDAHFKGIQPHYSISSDGLTVIDHVTGLAWTKSPDLDRDGDIDVHDKLTFSEAQSYPNTLNAQNFGGYDDWRLPTIKELYSLMNFSGTDPSGPQASNLTPFIDDNYFDFGYGDTNGGERLIDAQFWSSNIYSGTVFGNQTAAFGLNLADGRIKGYPASGGRITKTCYVYFVRGNTDYGINKFKDNSDGTITDTATGLMWSQDDSGNKSDNGPRSGMTWEEALAWVQQKNGESYLGYNDWRLPNAKEMQSIVDYSRSPDATHSAAIDPIFNVTQITNEAGQTDYPWYWTSTTHLKANGMADAAAYICFGRSLGYMNGSWIDVHGGGSQRSDQKSGVFNQYTYVSDGYYFNQSPQGDAARSYNYVRPVRDVSVSSGVKRATSAKETTVAIPETIELEQNYPNPFNPTTNIRFSLPSTLNVEIAIFNLQGQKVKTLLSGLYTAGNHQVTWDGTDNSGMKLASGVYIYQIISGHQRIVRKMNLLK